MEIEIPFPFRVLSVENGHARIECGTETPEVLPRLIARTDAPARLSICLRTFDKEVRRLGIKPVPGKPIRFREIDLLPLATPVAPTPALVALPKPPPSATAPKPAALSQPAKKIRLVV
jgi:hypothetical protein